MAGAADRPRSITIRWRAREPLSALGAAIESIYPIVETPCFDEAVEAIEKAERQVWDDRDPGSETRD